MEDAGVGKVGVDKVGVATQALAMLVTPTVVPLQTLAGLSRTRMAQALQATAVAAPVATQSAETPSVFLKKTPVIPPA